MTRPPDVTYTCPECGRTTKQQPGLDIRCLGSKLSGNGPQHSKHPMRPMRVSKDA